MTCLSTCLLSLSIIFQCTLEVEDVSIGSNFLDGRRIASRVGKDRDFACVISHSFSHVFCSACLRCNRTLWLVSLEIFQKEKTQRWQEKEGWQNRWGK